MTAEPSSQPHPHLRPLWIVLALLLLLLAGTTGVAFLDLGWLNTPVALLFSLVKASLVIAVFMKLPRSGHLVPLTLLAALFGLAILIGLSLADFLTRG